MEQQHPGLDALLDRIDVTARRERTVAKLSGGLTNRNYRVTVPDGDYVVRCFEGDTDLLDIDRDAEHDNTVAAATAGVGAPFVDYRRDLGALVIGYVDGVTFDNDSFDDPDRLARAGRAIRRLHDGPRFTGDFDMFTRQARYLRTVHERGFALPDGYEEQDDAFQQARAALAVHAPATVPCNNDLLAGNFVEDDRQVWLIDYEYAGNNDPCFELGNTSTECDLDADQVEALVTAYLGQGDARVLARVRLQALVSAYGWSLWGAIQAATSELDFDFGEWSRERFEKAARGFTSTGYPGLLEDVSRDDDRPS